MNIPHILKKIDEQHSMHYSWYERMHTRVDIVLCGKTETELTAVNERIFRLIARFEQLADRFNPQSELFAVNRGSGEKRISDSLFDMLDKCLWAHRATDGLFDITISSPDHTPQTIESVSLDAASHELVCDGVILDLNGFVKGYVLDRIKELLAATSIRDALINLGNSSILATGNAPYAQGWRITACEGARNAPEVTLHDAYMTTSGNLVPGRVHILHPQTHCPFRGERTLSVLTPTGWQGEILSTSLLIADPSQRAEILQRFHLSEASVFEWNDQ